MQMNLISLFFFAIAFLVIIASIRPNTDVFSPARIFTFVWAFIIGVTNLKLSWLQIEWNTLIWIQILIGPVAFLVGTFVVYILNFNKKILTLSYMRENIQIYKFNYNKLFSINIILFILFIVSYFVIFIKTGAIPAFAAKPWEVRRDFTIFGLGLFLHNVFLIVLLSCIYIIFTDKNKFKKILIGFLASIVVVMYSATLQRYQIILSIFIIVFLLFYTTKKINIKTVLVTGVLLISFFYLISSARLGELVLFILYRLSKMKFSPDYAIFTEPYMYISMNLENFANAIHKIHNFSYGYYTFDFLTAITGIKHWIEEYFFLIENPFLISINYNTYSAFWTYYRDFGVLGIYFIPFLGGVGLSSLYYSFKSAPTIKKLSFYGMFLYGVIFSFFNSVFGFLWFVYNIVVLLIIFHNIQEPLEIDKT